MDTDMKIRLLVNKNIMGLHYPAGSVYDAKVDTSRNFSKIRIAGVPYSYLTRDEYEFVLGDIDIDALLETWGMVNGTG